jgi:predicted nucleic acid-binding protein
MGILSAITGSFVYLDANIFIYALEAFPEYASELTVLFEAIDRGQFQAVTSELTLAETLVKPLMDGDVAKQVVYEQAVQSAGSE